MLKKSTLSFFILLIFNCLLTAQNGKSISKMVESYHQAQVPFEQVSLFSSSRSTIDNRPDLQRAFEDGAIFRLQTDEISSLLQNEPQTLTILLPGLSNERLELEVVKINLYAEGFSVRLGSTNDEVDSESISMGVHYRGIIKGKSNSLVSLSVFEDEISGLIADDNENYIISKIEDQNQLNEHILYREKELKAQPNYSCETLDDDKDYDPSLFEPRANTRDAGDCVGIYVEVDNDIFAGKGGLQNTINYVSGAFAQSATLYANDGITISVTEMFVWDTTDPYTSTSSSTLLSQFQNYRTSYNGDLGHLVGYAGGGGIAAGFSGLCNNNRANSMCYSGIDATYANVNTWSWTISVITHEMGHLLGSRHTHACVWNGNNTAIDGCYNTEGRCRRDRNYPSNGGTIMSYCHLTSVGINFNLGFGPQPTAVIQSNITNASCLAATCGGGNNPSCTNGIQDGDETGVDCGGSNCQPCHCTNGVQDGDESGVDCGGSCDAICPPPNTCDTPDGLFASNIKRTRADLNWNAVSGANDYTVQLRQQGASTWSQGTASGTSIRATSLSNGTTYEWQVRANCNSGNSPYSSICSFTAGSRNSGACGNNLIRGYTKAHAYPSPASNLLNVEIPISESTYQLRIVDLLGKVVQLVDEVPPGLRVLDVSNLENGLYLIQLTARGEQSQSIKFIVNH